MSNLGNCNNTVSDKLDGLLPHVQRPGRYIGHEINSVSKPWDSVDLRVALAFPDVYEIGMSHLGMQILYSIVNMRPDSLCERVFAPWIDLEGLMRSKDVPLLSLESRRPVSNFDVVGFSLQYELCYTTILNMLDLAGIRLRASERSDGDPIIIAGGPCAFNPEPMADFIDAFVIGDGEEALPEMLDSILDAKQGESPRRETVNSLAAIQGVYVPSLYDIEYGPRGEVKHFAILDENAPNRIRKRYVKDLDSAHFPIKQLIPYIEVAHDRYVLEIMRGCSNACRFCQAGVIYRPTRTRKLETLVDMACRGLDATGFENISLASLSSTDYPGIEDLVMGIREAYPDRPVPISLPSLRLDAFGIDLAMKIAVTRRTGLTFAPETGSPRLRRAINKDMTNEQILTSASEAFKSGWKRIKLYFMVGLPGEEKEDLDEIASLVSELARIARKEAGRKAEITVSVSDFVPKAHTPFQWEPMTAREDLALKHKHLQSVLRMRSVKLSWRDENVAAFEGLFARGGRRLGRLTECAWRKGSRFDAWTSEFNADIWLEALAELGMTTEDCRHADFAVDDVLPWNHIDPGVTKRFLLKEKERASEGEPWDGCKKGKCKTCGGCGLSMSTD
ncbi:TIGR03960 family B12-binding radical SAM protein [Candidatus Hydrogenedentota bacterium]